jgi:hypothetical protein
VPADGQRVSHPESYIHTHTQTHTQREMNSHRVIDGRSLSQNEFVPNIGLKHRDIDVLIKIDSFQ